MSSWWWTSDDDTCDVEVNLFENTNNGIEVIVVNGGSDVNNQFECFTNGNSDHLFNFDSIDEST